MRATPHTVDFGFKMLNGFHRTILRVSRGRLGSSAFGMLIVELHVAGRASGKIRSVLLAAPVADDRRIVLVASKGGDTRDPEWFRNVVVHPDVELTVSGERRLVRARVATHEEAIELWPRIVSVYKPYASYRARAGREIPLVICEPR